MVNSFTSQLATKKSAWTLFADHHTSVMLSPQETTPWTRVIGLGPATHHGQGIDLPAFARAYRERLVLKPNDAYGGHGIVCGWQTTHDD